MAVFKDTKIAADQPPITGGQAGMVVANRGTYEVPATLAANDVVQLAYLPAGHVPVDVILEADDLDTGTPAITLSVGVVDSAGTDLVASTNFLTASTVAQAGGAVHANLVTGLQLAASSAKRIVGVKVIAAAGTAAAGTLRLTVLSMPE